MHDEVLQQSRMRANLTYGIDGGLLDKPGEAWSLPYIYYYGKGITKNREEAFRLYSKLKDAGFKSPTVSLMLGRMYELGDGTSTNHEKACQYYEDASKNGNVIALSHLASSKLSDGHYFEGLLLKLKAAVKALVIGIRNPNDIRLKGS